MTNIEKAQKLERQKKELAVVQNQTQSLQQDYIKELDTNPQYSLEVDPENKYSMTFAQKEFVKYYVEFKNVNAAAELAQIDMNTAKSFFVAYASQQEIRRLNKALYHRQFASRLLTLDEIGGYLSSLLTGENVPVADQLKTSEKLKVAQMLIDLNTMKATAMLNPQIVMAGNFDVQLKDLSIETIKSLLKSSNKKTNDVVEVTDFQENLSPEEAAYLSTLPTEELLKLIDETNKEDSK